MSATDAWVVPLTGVADNTGVVTQCYPAWLSAGVDPASATNGQIIRKPMQGALHSLQVETDGSHGGTIQIYDISGIDLGVDVSSATSITAAVLNAAITAGTAKLIYENTFAGTAGSGAINAAGIYRSFMKGLGARFIYDSGPATCKLNVVVSGGFQKVESRGA
jgi:hypothetical protein